MELNDFGLYPSSKGELKIRSCMFIIELGSYISLTGRPVQVKQIFQKETILRSRAVVVVVAKAPYLLHDGASFADSFRLIILLLVQIGKGEMASGRRRLPIVGICVSDQS